MKKSIMTMLVVIVAITLTSKLSAQYSIPSFNVPVIGDPTTFEEVLETSASFGSTNLLYFNPFGQKPINREEKKLKATTSDPNTNTTSCIMFEVYSLDGTDIYGPFTVYEGEIFEICIDEREWGIRVLTASEESEMSVWIE